MRPNLNHGDTEKNGKERKRMEEKKQNTKEALLSIKQSRIKKI